MRRHILTLVTICSIIGSTLAQPAPDFTITASDGQTYSLYDDYLDQGKTVMIEVFFVICPPCISHAPALEILYQEWGAGQNDVEFIGLSDKAWDSNADVLGYEQTHGLSFHGAGMDGGALTALQPYINGTYGPYFGTPTFIIIAPDGSVNFDVSAGGVQANIIAIDAALAATGAVKPGTQVNHSVEGTVGVPQGGSTVSGVQISLNDAPTPFTTDANGTFAFTEIPAGTNVEITPSKNYNHKNGITTFDIIQLSRHILDISPLPSPYHMLAGDVNNSGTITTFDLIFLRKIILQIDTAFSQVPSWRFVPTDFTFTNPENPFLDNIPGSIIINDLNQNTTNLDFHAIKMGDANFSANPLALQQSESRSFGTALPIEVKDIQLQKGKSYIVNFEAQDFDDIIGLQASLQFDPETLEFADLQLSNSSLQMSEEHFGLSQVKDGFIRFSWNTFKDIIVEDGPSLFSIRFTARKDGRLKEVIRLQPEDIAAEAYTSGGEFRIPKLNFRDLTTIQLAPNPLTTDKLSVNFQNPISGQLTYRIFDISGQLLSERSSGILGEGQQTVQLNVGNLPPGVYQLSLFNSEQFIGSSKLLKL